MSTKIANKIVSLQDSNFMVFFISVSRIKKTCDVEIQYLGNYFADFGNVLETIFFCVCVRKSIHTNIKM